MSTLNSIRRALALRPSFPKAHALDLLDVVFEGHTLHAADCKILVEQGAVDPQTLAFIASAFDRGMTEKEWCAWQEPPADPQLQAAVRGLWLELIVPAFTDRYTGSDRPPLHQQPSPRCRSTMSL